MLNLNIELEPETEKKIKRILGQLTDKKAFFQNMIDHQTNELRKGIVNIEADLKKFEHKYHQPTKDFYRKFANGELEDGDDFMIWAGIYEMQQESKRKLAELE